MKGFTMSYTTLLGSANATAKAPGAATNLAIGYKDHDKNGNPRLRYILLAVPVAELYTLATFCASLTSNLLPHVFKELKTHPATNIKVRSTSLYNKLPSDLDAILANDGYIVATSRSLGMAFSEIGVRYKEDRQHSDDLSIYSATATNATKQAEDEHALLMSLTC